MSSTYHIPFPRAFLAVNTPVKNSSPTSTSPPTDTIQPQQPDHGFLSNRASAHPRTTSISSTVSDSSTASVGAPPSPPAAPAVASPVLGAKVFAPLAVNAKHAPLQSLADMTPVARSAFLSNRGPSF